MNYQAQDVLLEEVEKVFTPDDNEFLLKLPTKEELHKYLCNSNMHAAPGSDGLTSYLYKQHWDLFGESLTELATMIHQGEKPTQSQRTSLMVFGSKPKKPHSCKPSDKHKISFGRIQN